MSDVLAIFDFGVSGSIITPYEFDNAGGGGITGPINADDVAYGDSDVQAILDGLLYVAPQIGSFANNRGTVEKGSTITSVHLSWSLNKDMDSLSLNQSIGEIDADATSYDVTSVSLTSDTTYTLTADDGTSQTQASTSVAFRQKRYWGVSSETSLDNSGILALGNSEFSTNLSKSITYDCTGGAYPYFAYPASFGQPQNVTVGGLAFTDFAINTQTFTNASGYAESYYVIRFNGIQTGSSIKVVWG
ncbi:hypothetical protein GC176_20520 [bacterium]|nr:hypothetical protein [bacterium]